jgi:ATP-dependent RNA helicase DHX57
LQGLGTHTEAVTSIISPESATDITGQLQRLGFKPRQATNAVEYLSKPSAVSANLLETFPPLEACIEYLVLHVPECDLPRRFLPSNNASNPFVTSVHSGNDDLKRRWIEERAVKVAGWPPHVVKQCTEDARLVEDWALLIVALTKRLLGDEVEEVFTPTSPEDCFVIQAEDVEALGGHFEDAGHCVLPLFSAPIVLHILVSSEGLYPNRFKSPIYLTSTSVPAYIRLHLLSSLLQSIKRPEFLDSPEGFLMAAMQCIEEHWAQVEDKGPPDISSVLQHMMPVKQSQPRQPVSNGSSFGKSKPIKEKKFKDIPRRVRRSDAEIKGEYERIREGDKVSNTYL